MDVYYEKNIINERMRENYGKTKFLNVLWWIFVGVLAIGILILTSAPFTNDTPHIIGRVLSYVFLIGTTVGGMVFINNYFKKNNSEYDYVVSSGTLRIIRIINEKKRVPILEVETLSVQYIGLTNTDEYSRLKDATGSKIIDAYCSDDDVYVYIYCTIKSVKTIVLCEFDSEFIKAIKLSGLTYNTLGEELKNI